MAGRTPGRHFRVADSTIARDLQKSMRRMDATGLRVAQDFDSGSATVTFDRDGRRYVMECSNYYHTEDNLRAIGKTIDALYRALEFWGVERSSSDTVRGADSFAAFFNGFALVPDQLQLPSGADWWQVLGVSRDADVATIRSAFRALSREYHPDVSDDPETFKRIKTAYDAAMKARGGSW